MPDHLRAQIRRQTVDQLLGLDLTELRVFPTRRHPLSGEELPALCVYAISESSERMNMGSVRHLRRTLDLVIEGVAQDNDAIDDTLDEIANQVEAAIGADPTLGGLAYDCVLTRSTIQLQQQQTAELKTGSVAMTFTVQYRARETDPSTST